MSFRYLLGGVAFAALATPYAYEAQAQQTAATLRGTITDAQGAPVSSAQVFIRDTRNNATSVAVTTADGNFVETALRVGGPYEVTISAAGFEGQQIDIGSLSIGSNAPVSISLNDEATEVIVVTGSARRNIIDIANGVGTVFSAEDIQDTPLIDRDLTSVIELDPLVSVTGDSGELGVVSFGGIEPRLNGFTVDGAIIADRFKLEEAFYPTLRQPISIDVIEEVAATFSEYSVLTTGAQGGLVNTVTRSGTNEIDGNIFYRYGDDGLIGDHPFGSRVNNGEFEETEFGLTLAGPIVKDKLFFTINYEEFEASTPVLFDFSDDELGTFEEVRQVFLTATDDDGNLRYDGFDPGVKTNSALDETTAERLFLKLDWQINDNHRLAGWYLSTEDARLQNTDNLDFLYPTSYYDKTTEIDLFHTQLVSNWTDNLTTTFRVIYKEQTTGQNSRGDTSATGTQFPTFVIEGTGLGDDLQAGPDPFRQANAFEDEQLQVFGAADYVMGDHVLTFGSEYLTYEIFNLFGQFCRGEYTFASIDDLRDGNAELTYQNTPSNECADRVAEWGYDRLDLFVQDQWQVSPTLNLTFGLRYERYISDDDPQPQGNFSEEYGADSAGGLDGLDIIQPRFGFSWDAPYETNLQGGVGLFSGGDPVVWFSNAFSPLPTSVTNDVTNVTNVTNVPDQFQSDVERDTGPFNYDHIDPDFEIPSLWKASLSANRLFNLGPLGNDWNVGVQVAYAKVNKGAVFVNRAQIADEIVDPELAAAVEANTGVAPDGRPIYQSANTGYYDKNGDGEINSLDASGDAIMLTNSNEGESLALSIAADKAFDNGFSVYGSYTFTDSERLIAGSSSRHISNYRSLVTTDRNSRGPAGTSVFEVEDRFTFQGKFERNFFGDLETQFVLRAIFESGAVSNAGYVQSSANRIFGRAAGGSPFSGVDQIYVPELNADGTGFDDSKVVFASEADEAAVFNEFDRLGLLGDAGGFTEKNGLRGPWNQRFDLGFTQELPGIPGAAKYVGDNRLKLTVDIFNLANLLNDDWGTQYDGARFDSVSVVRPQLLKTEDVGAFQAGATDLVISPSAAGATCKVASDCVYVYSTGFGGDPFQRDLEDSVWKLRIGLRYEF